MGDKTLKILLIANSHGLDATTLLRKVFQTEMPEQNDSGIFFDFIEYCAHCFKVHCFSPIMLSKSASMAIAVCRSATVAPLALA